MANLTIPKSFPKLAGGLLEATILALLLDAFRKGETATLTVSEIAESTGENDSQVRWALEKLWVKGLLSIDKVPGQDIKVLRLRKVRFDIDCTTVQAELDLEESEDDEYGDAGKGSIGVDRETRMADLREFGGKIIARARVEPIKQDDGDGTLYFKLTISVNDVGAPIENEILRVEDPEQFPSVRTAFEWWDTWADAYQIETAADSVEAAPVSNPVTQVEDLIRSGILKPDGGGIITIKLAPRSFRALGEMLEVPDFHLAEGFFEASERNWQVHRDDEGIELDGLGESASGESEEAA